MGMIGGLIDVDIDNDPPTFTNSEGVKWWHEKHLTGYAKLKGLSGITCWIAMLPTGSLRRIIIRDGEIIHEDTTIEGIACYIEALWMIKNDR